MTEPRSFARINLEQARKQAKELVKAHAAGEPKALDTLRWSHPRFRGQSDEQIRSGKFALADAQFVIARHHHLASWAKLLEYVETLENANPVVARFENAADAIVTGNIDTLRGMLNAHPELIYQRSTRAHASTLLHYVSANGVENYRQRTPPNIVEITTLLLDHGAEVDATSGAYGGGSTTLGLVSTSAHPRLAGVQIALIDLLIERGAKIDGPDTLPGLVRWAIGNGCPEASNHMAALGKDVPTLYAAAGVGDLARVQALFASASQQQCDDALTVSAQMGHVPVATFLLDHGASVRGSSGMPPLHAACSNGHFPMMELLLRRGADLEQKNEFGGAALDSTLWFAYNVLDEEFAKRDFPHIIEWLIAAGSRTDLYPELKDEIAGVYRRANR